MNADRQWPTFLHSGDLGDIIYGLPVIRAMGGGILYLDPRGGAADPYCWNFIQSGRTKLDAGKANWLLPLLRAQPYIAGADLWNGEKVDHNLNRMRTVHWRMGFRDIAVNITQYHLRAFGLDEGVEQCRPWLTAPPDKALVPAGRTVAVNRTARYQSNHHWWAKMAPVLEARAYFMGLPREHELFQESFGISLPATTYTSAMEMASALAATGMLLANQSLALALAIGLGVKFKCELYKETPDCMFVREGCEYL